MGTIVLGSGTVGVTLTSASQNPVLVSGTGTIDVAGAYASAIYANFGIAGSITNDGLLEAPNGYGVFLKSGGTIINGSTLAKSAKITGGVVGVKIGIHGTGTVDNFGTIASTGTTQGIGVQALANASVVNGSPSDTSALISGYFDGVEISGSGATISNFGTITATGTSTIVGSSSFGVYLTKGGTVTNGSVTDTNASIQGALFSIEIAHGPGTVVNFGTIKTTGPLGRGILLEDGGSVTNNVAGYITASGRSGVYIGGPGAGNVTNLGKIYAARTGVAIETGGTVTNGSNTDKTALISGARNGVYIAGLLPAAVKNFGTIMSTGPSDGVNLYLGGQVTNGSTLDTTALITGGNHGVDVGGLSTINNFGTITSGGKAAITMLDGGTVVNGSASDTVARIALVAASGSHAGVYDKEGLTTIVNFGTITSSIGAGVDLYLGGGAITNGSTVDKGALIQGVTGSSGISIGSSPATVTNFGTITGGNGVHANALITISNFGTIKAGAFNGIDLAAGGVIVNGSATDTTASIKGVLSSSVIFVSSGPLSVANYGTISGGAQGIHAGGLATIRNFGTITSGSFAAVGMLVGGTLINGSTADKTAVIAGPSGNIGIFAPAGVATITNSGTITGATGLVFSNGTTSATATVTNAGSIVSAGGTAGTAISFGSGNDRLIIDPGAVFIGKVFGGSGTNVLELAHGSSAGTIGGIGSEFSGFQQATIDAAATWNVSGSGNSIATLANNGTLGLDAHGTLTVTGSVVPSSSGVFLLENSGVLEIAQDTGASNKMKFISPGQLIVDNAAHFGTNVGGTLYTGPLIENFGGTGDSILLKNVLAAGAVLNYSTATGLLQLTGSGTATLHFSGLGAGFHVTADLSGHAVITHS